MFLWVTFWVDAQKTQAFIHRSKLIGQELAKLDIEMVHIDEKGRVKTQQDVISMLVKDIGLFDDEPKFTSRKAYQTPGATDVR